MSDNMIKPFGNNDDHYHYGVLPITIDSTRSIPYVQYALVKQGAEVLQPGEVGAKLPPEFNTGDTTGPIFSVSFMFHGPNTLVDITTTQFESFFTPTLSSAPLMGIAFDEAANIALHHNLDWDSDDVEFSMWPAVNPNESKITTLTVGKQYCVTTRPLEWSVFNNIPSGVVHFSLEPTADATYDGVNFGVLAVTYRMKLNRAIT